MYEAPFYIWDKYTTPDKHHVIVFTLKHTHFIMFTSKVQRWYVDIPTIPH